MQNELTFFPLVYVRATIISCSHASSKKFIYIFRTNTFENLSVDDLALRYVCGKKRTIIHMISILLMLNLSRILNSTVYLWLWYVVIYIDMIASEFFKKYIKRVLNMKYAIFCLENNVDIDKTKTSTRNYYWLTFFGNGIACRMFFTAFYWHRNSDVMILITFFD